MSEFMRLYEEDLSFWHDVANQQRQYNTTTKNLQLICIFFLLELRR